MDINIQDRLQAWAEKTVSVYKRFANQLKDEPQSKYTAFYTQSDLSILSDRPQLAILAINPNSTCSYADQVANPYWRLEPTIGMTAEHFLRGNPDFPNRDKWRLWNRMQRMLQLGGIEKLVEADNSFAYVNIVNFNSPHPQDIPSDIFSQCAVYTFKLIDLLQPKFIICLGKAPFDVLVKHSHSKVDEVIAGEVDRIAFGKSLVVRIPHTSKFYTYEEMEMIGKALALLFHHPEYDSAQIRNDLTKEIQSFKDRRLQTSKKVCKGWQPDIDSIPLNYNLIDVVHQRYLFATFLELTVDIKKRSIGIRHLVRHSNYLKHSEPNEAKLREILRNFGFVVEKTQENCAWLGRKNLQAYGVTKSEILTNIHAELKKIEELVHNLSW